MHPLFKSFSSEPEERIEEQASSHSAALALFLNNGFAAPTFTSTPSAHCDEKGTDGKTGLESRCACSPQAESQETVSDLETAAEGSSQQGSEPSLIWKKWTDPCAVSPTMMTSTDFSVKNPIRAKLATKQEGLEPTHHLEARCGPTTHHASMASTAGMDCRRREVPMTIVVRKRGSEPTKCEIDALEKAKALPSEATSSRASHDSCQLEDSTTSQANSINGEGQDYMAYSESAMADLFSVFNSGAHEEFYEPIVEAFQSTAVRIKSVARRAYLSLQERYPFDTMLSELHSGRTWFMDIIRTGRMYHAIVYVGSQMRVYWLGWIQPMMITGASSVSSSLHECKQVFQELCDGRERAFPLDSLLGSLANNQSFYTSSSSSSSSLSLSFMSSSSSSLASSAASSSASSLSMAEASVLGRGSSGRECRGDPYYASLDPCQSGYAFQSFYGRRWQLAPTNSCATVRVSPLPLVTCSQEPLSPCTNTADKSLADDQVGLDYQPWIETESAKPLLCSEQKLAQDVHIEKSRAPFLGQASFKSTLNGLVSQSEDRVDKVVKCAENMVHRYAEQSDLLKSFQSGLFRFEKPEDASPALPLKKDGSTLTVASESTKLKEHADGTAEEPVKALHSSNVDSNLAVKKVIVKEKADSQETSCDSQQVPERSSVSLLDDSNSLSDFELISTDDIEAL